MYILYFRVKISCLSIVNQGNDDRQKYDCNSPQEGPQLYLTNINNIYSIFPPLFLTTAFNLLSKLRMRHAAFLGKSSSILVASSPFNLSSDCLFSTLTWSIAYFPCLIELFYHLANRYTANMQLLAMEELLWPFLCRVTIVFLSIVISRVEQLILTLKFLNLFINILMNRFNAKLNLQRSEN